LLARSGGIRWRSGRACPSWQATCQRQAWPGSQDFDPCGHPASRRWAGFCLVNADVVSGPVLRGRVLSRPVPSRPVLSGTVLSQPVLIPGAYRCADRHSFTDSLSYANRHVIGYPSRHADTQRLEADAKTKADSQAIRALAHPLSVPERPAVAEKVSRVAARHRRLT
jgi:hypothetical protein